MPDTKISALSDAGALTGSEIVPLANGAANERTTTQAIADLGGGEAAMGAVVTNSGSQNLLNNTPTFLTFDTEVVDDAAYFAPGTPDRFTITDAGWYAVAGGAHFSSNATAARAVDLVVNGTTTIAQRNENTAGTGALPMWLSTVHKFAASDYVQIRMNQTSGATLTATSARLSIVKL